MDTDELVDVIETYKRMVVVDYEEQEELSDYGHGLHNGLEMALALIENRPAFHIKKNMQYHKHDLESYPEYFL